MQAKVGFTPKSGLGALQMAVMAHHGCHSWAPGKQSKEMQIHGFVYGIPTIPTPLTLSLYFLVFWGYLRGKNPPQQMHCSCPAALCGFQAGSSGSAQHRAGTLQQVPVPSAGPTAGWGSLGQAEISWICRRAFVTTPNLCRSPVQPVAQKAITVNVISS